eukprot:3355948-Rhodomonas_salina.1
MRQQSSAPPSPPRARLHAAPGSSTPPVGPRHGTASRKRAAAEWMLTSRCIRASSSSATGTPSCTGVCECTCPDSVSGVTRRGGVRERGKRGARAMEKRVQVAWAGHDAGPGGRQGRGVWRMEGGRKGEAGWMNKREVVSKQVTEDR